ncbi:MAG TPA: class I SAM-dependent methyltransferase [Spirochaetota bacterium]|mgnify:CR=1 FL=1|nr:class I SAM-dependent methyltransferase [Spirochaetota bacterium]
MDYEKIVDYLSVLNSNNKEDRIFYDDILDFKNVHFIPAVRFDVAIFLNLISNIAKPKKILEIGFGSGVSSVFIGKDLKNIERFVSLEKDENRYNRGLELFENFNIDYIDLQFKNSFDFFEDNNEKFDYIFLDAEKTKYDVYIPLIKDALNKGGVLIGDNIIFSGRVVEGNPEKKYVKGVSSIKKYNLELSSDGDFKTLFLNIGDGISLSLKK